MILVDANLLLYAEDNLSSEHEAARTWWDERLSGEAPVCLCWPVLLAFVRIGTNPRLHQRPLTFREATQCVQSWLDQPCTRIVQPTSKHWSIFQHLAQKSRAVGNLISDAHLATLAIEHNCVLQSTDGDFARFPSLKWENPLK